MTDVRRTGRWTFDAAASWSPSHPTFPRDGARLHHPLLVVETLRELGIVVPLSYFGVAKTTRFVITDMFFRLDPRAEPTAGYGATEVTCRAEVGNPRIRSDGTLTGLRLTVDLLAGGRAFARAGGGVRFVAADRFAALRGGRGSVDEQLPGEPGGRPEAALLGVPHGRDIVIGLEDGHAVVHAADRRHPFFFDHAVDHIPGMLLLEAARQAAVVAGGTAFVRPRAGRLKALRFTEFSPAARIECAPRRSKCGFRIVQGGVTSAYGVLQY